MKLFLSMIAVLGLATGCVTNVYDSKQEGKTIMDKQVCQNGVCTPETVLGNGTKKQVKDEAAPVYFPQNPPPSPYSALPSVR